MRAAFAVAGLALTGWALESARLSPGAPVSERCPAASFGGQWTRVGQVAVWGALGGVRVVVADFLWLRMAGAWEVHDLAATDAWIELVTAIDPEPLYFWINGARILAYDMPTWQIEAGGGPEVVPAAVQVRLVKDQARRALRRLQEARASHPHCAALWIEQANIELNRLGDLRSAAESYRRAWEEPGAPWFAARLHAEMLRRLGERRAALQWLVALHPGLPRNDASAGAALVLARIRVLERELDLPPEQMYGSPGGVFDTAGR